MTRKTISHGTVFHCFYVNFESAKNPKRGENASVQTDWPSILLYICVILHVFGIPELKQILFLKLDSRNDIVYHINCSWGDLLSGRDISPQNREK